VELQLSTHCFTVFLSWKMHIDTNSFRSKRIKDLAVGYGFNGIIAGTRKTTPGALH
jgi:hypothetical protein